MCIDTHILCHSHSTNQTYTYMHIHTLFRDIGWGTGFSVLFFLAPNKGPAEGVNACLSSFGVSIRIATIAINITVVIE